MGTSATATGVTRYLLEAVGKFATARLRQVGAMCVHPNWEARAAVCERCPLRVISCGVSYCGNPLLRQLDRDPTVDGCGCPCHDKSKDPTEHCPIDSHHQAAAMEHGACSCKWCKGGNQKSETRMTNQIRNQNVRAKPASDFVIRT
jgi:hypothetical protein